MSEKSSENAEYITSICSACGKNVQVDSLLIYTKESMKYYGDEEYRIMNYFHSRHSYSMEVEPEQWVTFCKKACEIKYYNQKK